MRARFTLLASALIILLILVFWYPRASKHATQSSVSTKPPVPPVTSGASTSSGSAPTNVYAHNLLLRKGPSFRVYVRWLRGQMARTHRNVNPSFDDPESFFIDIKTGVLRVNIGDISNYLSAGMVNSPLKNMTLSGDGNQIKLTGTLHKVVPLPIQVTGAIAALPDNRIQIHVTKLNVMKIPFKALLGGLNITVSDLFRAQRMPGIEVSATISSWIRSSFCPHPTYADV